MSPPDPGGAAPPILATKLHAPRRRVGAVERPRLTDRLRDPTLPALTVVAAPAGFGKTTLLADGFTGVEPGRRRTAWLSLDAGDNDPTVFWTYVIVALQAVLPDVGAGAAALLRSSQPMASVLGSLLNDLADVAARPPDDVDDRPARPEHDPGHDPGHDRGDDPGLDAVVDVVLVLDDYHVIESAELHESLAFLVEHLPPHVHLVLGARADPPLPLARLRARGELLELRAADLRFTPTEAADYCNRTMGLHLVADDVAALESRTEGWIAALQLAALSLQGRDDASGFIADFAGDDRFVVDYLAEEVLERQPDDVRTFLLETAVMDRFTGALCDAVTDGSGGRAMLERLERANLFLVPLDDRRRWYRYHHLFADVLRARLLDEAPERVDELHRRASAWFEAAADDAEAVAHALAGHDVARAARLIELAAPALFRTRQEATARRWLTALPPEIFPARPVLSIELVGARMVSGELTGVEELLAGIERWLEPGTGPGTGPGTHPDADPTVDLGTAIVFDHDELAHLPAQVAVYRAALALIAGDLAGTMAHATRALELTAPTDHLRQGSAQALIGLAQWTIGDLGPASRRYAESIASLTAAGHVSDVLGCSIAAADMQRTLGHLGEARRTYESGLMLAEAHGVVRGTADMHVGLADVLLELDDLAGARRHLEASAQLGEVAGLPQHPYRWRVASARLRRAEGDLRAAIELLEAAEGVYNTDMSPPVRPVSAVLATTRLAGGDLDGPRRWATARGLRADDELSYVREYEHLTLARVLLATASSESTAPIASTASTASSTGTDAVHADADAVAAVAAGQLLERLLAAAEAGGRHGSAVEILVVLALARRAVGDRSGATAALEQALVLAQPEGRLRPFLDEGPALAPLLAALASDGPTGDHARRVLAAAPDGAGAPFGVGESFDGARSEGGAGGWSGDGRAGQGRGGQGRVGQGWTGQERTGHGSAARPEDQGLVDELSGRELEVLRLLRSDLSGPDIARELTVSLNTVRTHTKNIYMKLGVNSRREAVTRARELGL